MNIETDLREDEASVTVTVTYTIPRPPKPPEGYKITDYTVDISDGYEGLRNDWKEFDDLLLAVQCMTHYGMDNCNMTATAMPSIIAPPITCTYDRSWGEWK